MKFTISHSTVNKLLNKVLTRPRKAKTTFKLTDTNKDKRIELIQWVKDNKVKGKDIFFTDESRFLLDTPLNSQTNQIRFNKEDEKKLKSGDTKIYEKVNKPMPKYTSGFMVAGGMSTHGLGKLIFCVGTMNTFAYQRTLDYFKEDVNRLNSDLYFQQDGASCHTSKKSIDHIETLFNNKLPFWPAISQDLSRIEMIWALLKQKLQELKHKTLEELKAHLIFLWNRVPKGLCKKLIAQFDRKIKIIEESGDRINILPKKKKKMVLKKRLRWEKKWNVDNQDDTIERIVYNDKRLLIDKKRSVKAIKKEIVAIRKVFKAVNRQNMTDTQIDRITEIIIIQKRRLRERSILRKLIKLSKKKR